ncbi:MULTISPECIES: hypothetical protein [unclassified Bradyrhizobium]|uniref:hypothetical protein n=1 Tax=unclassified Bradyrhizobium TaxID=2631580 RepID=UPI0024792012|nr:MULTISPECIES: hypothetical protein [unclassified Bradyrhizobium]WGR69485.1 hypothetical protein MTX24_29240 [Bradyrhizobium sp. ISRA426]WGR81540.1 hypothetical protein MTX21_14350 [Bradyrhizobium sp. ISRA430]WGR84724.1 hypothetical protein MTX25_28915 [Bradyrhizobium sp. ISRA432]
MIEDLPAAITYGKETKPAAFSLRARISWQNERAAVPAMNSRRFIRSSLHLEDDGTQRITH